MGIFRRAPNNATLHKVKDMINRGEIVDLSELGDCHLSAVLMKLFLRELPEPLLTFRAYPSIVEIRGKLLCIMAVLLILELLQAHHH